MVTAVTATTSCANWRSTRESGRGFFHCEARRKAVAATVVAVSANMRHCLLLGFVTAGLRTLNCLGAAVAVETKQEEKTVD